MSTHQPRLLAAATLAGLVACASHKPPAPTTPTLPAAATAPLPTRFDAAAIDAHVASTVASKHMVGASLAILRDGQIVLAKGYGKRTLGGPEVDPDTIFGIGSVSKQFTCAATLLLADEGKLAMSDKVARHLPSLARAAEITLADVGGHLSGYHDYYPLDYTDSRMRAATTPDAILGTYASGALDFDPRSRRSYSNTGYVVLGRIVEKVSGKPFTEFLRERIIGPLRLEHTSHDRPPGDANLAAGHTSFFLGPVEATPAEEREWMWAAGAMYSTASDLLRWDLALIDGKLLSKNGFAALTTSQHLTDGRATDYACGLGVARRRGETVLQHTGSVSGYLAYNAFVPRTRSAVVLLLNADHVDGRALFDEILDLVTLDAGAIPVVTGPPADVAARRLFVELQHDRVDRSRLTEAFSGYLAPARVTAAAPRLAALGEPTAVTVEGQYERGALEVSVLRFAFKERSLSGLMYRSPDGKIHELLVSEE